jgi:hypothetical protein
MSSASATCPHCNAVQPDRDPRRDAPASDEPSSRRGGMLEEEKARALLILHNDVERTRVPSTMGELFEYAIFPRTRGARRWLEVLLTVPAVPLLALAIVLVKTCARRFRVYVSFGSLVVGVPVAAVAGYGLARAVGIDHLPALTLFLVMAGSWLAREIVRWSEPS